MTIVLPTVEMLATERDPSKRLLALVEPASRMLVRATALDEVNEIRSQAEAIERYARAIRLSTEAIGAAQTIARRAEVRIGELDEKRGQGGRPRKDEKPLSADNGLDRFQRHDFRTMAEATDPTVEDVLGELAPAGTATRAAVLRKIKEGRVEEAGKEIERRLDQSPIAEIVELQSALRRAVKGLQQMREYGQAFSAAPLAQRVVKLCRKMEELLDVDE